MAKGSSLEKLILASTRDVRLTQVKGEVVRIPGGRMVQKEGPVDFFGLYVPMGRTLVFDAKQCANPNRLVTSKDHLTKNQREQIIAYGKAGAIAGILAESTHHRRLYWLKWEALADNAPSYPWDHAMMFEIGSAARTVDWACVVVAHEQKLGSIRAALDAIWEAGGKAWDKIEDPDAYIREMRGDDPAPARGKENAQ